MSKIFKTLVSAVILLSPSFLAIAQEKPDVVSINASNSPSYAISDGLQLGEVSTIEFWVKPSWENIEYDPAILSANGEAGVRYAIVMGQNKNLIGLYSGNEWDFVEFDFKEERLYHVAFVILGELVDVFIDGEFYDTIAQEISDIPANSFHIGSIDGFSSLFLGDLAGVRIWDTGLEADTIKKFFKINILNEVGLTHPDFKDLIGASDFNDGMIGFLNFSIEEDVTTEDLTAKTVGFEILQTADETEEFLLRLEGEPDMALVNSPDDPEEEKYFDDNYDVLGGLDEEIALLKQQGKLDQYTVDE